MKGLKEIKELISDELISGEVVKKEIKKTIWLLPSIVFYFPRDPKETMSTFIET
ncbi:MAG TPA: hypothetical protein VIK86_09060 [Candidatus Paceibacterota bacterium]